MNFDSVIIGAGISGLVAAYRLKKMGRDLLIIESSAHVGGVIQSFEAEGFLIERGPNSLRGSHEFLDLVEELAELLRGRAERKAADEKLLTHDCDPELRVNPRALEPRRERQGVD